MKNLGSKLLETQRLFLHSTEESDLKELWNIVLLEEVSKYYLTSKINEDWEKEKKNQYQKLEHAKDNNIYTWTIQLKEDQSIIGQVGFHEQEKTEEKDIECFLDPSYQKKGYATEAVTEALKYMFLEVEINSIKTFVATKNESSIKLMERLGFKREKVKRKIKYTRPEKEIECYQYSLTKKDFLKEQFRKERLYIDFNVDKDPYVKSFTEDFVLNITGESGSGKTTLASQYLENPNCIVIDTDNVFSDRIKNKEEKELYKYLKEKYQELPDLCQNFDEIYKDILACFEKSDKMLVIDSAQYRNMKNLSLLKGKIIVLRTCVNNCYERCLKRYEEIHDTASFEEKASYVTHKRKIYQWVHLLNNFIDRLDKEGNKNG